MTRQHVISDAMQTVGYDFAHSILEIEFNETGTYHYLEVPKEICLGLLEAPSKGAYFNANIKDKYVCIKIE